MKSRSEQLISYGALAALGQGQQLDPRGRPIFRRDPKTPDAAIERMFGPSVCQASIKPTALVQGAFFG